MVSHIVFNVSSRDIRQFDPDPDFDENVKNNEKDGPNKKMLHMAIGKELASQK